MPAHFTSYFIYRLKNLVPHQLLKNLLLFRWISSVSHPNLDQTYLYPHLSLDVINSLPSRLLKLAQVQLPKLPQYTLKDVAAHCTDFDCWMVIRDRVFDLTDFLREVCHIKHPKQIKHYIFSSSLAPSWFWYHAWICWNRCNNGIRW